MFSTVRLKKRKDKISRTDYSLHKLWLKVYFLLWQNAIILMTMWKAMRFLTHLRYFLFHLLSHLISTFSSLWRHFLYPTHRPYSFLKTFTLFCSSDNLYHSFLFLHPFLLWDSHWFPLSFSINPNSLLVFIDIFISSSLYTFSLHPSLL